MNLSAFSMKKPVTTIMIALCILIFGVVSFSKLPVDLYPDIEVPVAVVMTTYSGAGPQEIETLVTRPIEETLGSVSGISEITSRSSEGQSIVICSFSYGTDMDFASLDMREKVDLIKGYLPSGASNPMIMAVDVDSVPVFMVSLSGSKDLASLQSLAEDSIKPRLERIDGVASVSISGGYDNKVEVSLNQNALNGYGLTIEYVSNMLAADNLSLPSGEVKNGGETLTIRTTGKFESLDDIQNALIPLPTGGTIRLSDIADVSLSHDELSSITRVDGESAVMLSIQKQSGTNTVSVAKVIASELDTIVSEQNDCKITTLFNQADYINMVINTIIQSVLLGALFAVLVLFLFLKNVRSTVIIAISIPASIVVTLTALYAFGITLNLMTLGGLALGVGMMVDNSIVVLENIFRLRQLGHQPYEASLEGSKEVALAITASTLTTVAVFLPIVFVEGITSTMFRELAITVTISLAASLLVSLTLVPIMAWRMLPKNLLSAQRGKKRLNPFAPLDRFGNALLSLYKKLLSAAMRHRLAAVLLSIAVLVGSSALALTVGVEYFPSSDQGSVSVNISLPNGSELQETDDIVTRVTELAEQVPEAASVYTTSGSASLTGETTASTGSVTLNLKPQSERTRSADEIASDLRSHMTDIAGAEITVSSAGTMDMGSMTGSAIDVMIKGDDLDELSRISGELVEMISAVPGAVEVSSDYEEGFPEVEIRILRENASRFGLTAAQIASAVKNMVSGQTATRFTYEDTEIDVIVKASSDVSDSLSALQNLMIQTPAGAFVPVSLVADVDIVNDPSRIVRDNQVRAISITGDVQGADVGTVNTEIENRLKAYPFPTGYKYEIGGESAEIASAFSDLGLALILAIVLVFVVLASQFESILLPFAILLSIPLGLSGGMLALYLTGTPLSVIAFIGLIMLSGIVVNNAIVLIDYINNRRLQGLDRLSAIMEAGPIRIRPVLMTTLTTILGLLPMALGFGEGAELEAPLAITMIGGLLLSTVLTLVVIPVLYSLIDDLAAKFRRTPAKELSGGEQA